MPYVKQTVRDTLDGTIDELSDVVNRLHKMEGRDRDGMLNYAFTKLLLQCYPNVSYKTINEAIGVLECCKLEMYRRLAAPYEDSKIEENTDVYT
jgi:hypothetical protein